MGGIERDLLQPPQNRVDPDSESISAGFCSPEYLRMDGSVPARVL